MSESDGKLTCAFLAVATGIVFLFGVGYLIDQIFGFLNTGIWEPKSILDILLIYDIEKKWVLNPDSLYGLHKVLGFINGGFAIAIIGACLCVAYLKHYSELKSK